MKEPCRGRFAPSPTGPLHFGSLVAALGSWLDARSRGGQWLVRIEDLDPPRNPPGAADAILRCLERWGLHWDGPVLYQSHRSEAYRAALESLEANRLAYPCTCTRREIRATSPDGRYPGHCRGGPRHADRPPAWRLRVDDAPAGFRDRLRGRVQTPPPADFTLRRADGLWSYQLAVVVDDAFQGITDIVRGADLMDATPGQIHLQRLLGLPRPEYAHLPLALGPDARKLSKQNRARPIAPGEGPRAIARALEFLGHPPPAALHGAPAAELLAWGKAHWSLARVGREDRPAPVVDGTD